MGWGDELMAAGEARRVHQQTGNNVTICDAHGRPRTHDAWKNVSYIVTDGSGINIRNGKACRPYTSGHDTQRWYFKDYTPYPAEIVFSDDEKSWANAANGYVIIEPTIKETASPNKQWPMHHWISFIQMCLNNGIKLAQIGNDKSKKLNGVDYIETPTLRIGASVLSGAMGYVGHEGGLHHTAAAVGIPAVVIMGGFISKKQTGYQLPNHRYLDDQNPCGSRIKCQHCQDAMEKIKPEMVYHEMEYVLR